MADRTTMKVLLARAAGDIDTDNGLSTADVFDALADGAPSRSSARWLFKLLGAVSAVAGTIGTLILVTLGLFLTGKALVEGAQWLFSKLRAFARMLKAFVSATSPTGAAAMAFIDFILAEKKESDEQDGLEAGAAASAVINGILATTLPPGAFALLSGGMESFTATPTPPSSASSGYFTGRSNLSAGSAPGPVSSLPPLPSSGPVPRTMVEQLGEMLARIPGGAGELTRVTLSESGGITGGTPAARLLAEAAQASGNYPQLMSMASSTAGSPPQRKKKKKKKGGFFRKLKGIAKGALSLGGGGIGGIAGSFLRDEEGSARDEVVLRDVYEYDTIARDFDAHVANILDQAPVLMDEDGGGFDEQQDAFGDESDGDAFGDSVGR